LLPHVPTKLLDERVRLMVLHATTALATREVAAEGSAYWAEFWTSETSQDSFLASLEGILRQGV